MRTGGPDTIGVVETVAGPWLLWLRAAVVGVAVFGIGAISHVSADGLMPGAGVSSLLLVICIVLAAPLLERPATRRRLVAMVVGGQTALHLALSLTAGHGTSGQASSTAAANFDSAPSLPVVDGRRVGSLRDAYDAGTAGAAPAVDPDGAHLGLLHLVTHLITDAPMMLAHTVAAVLVGLVCAYGEQILWSVLLLASGRFAIPGALPALAVPGPRGGRVRRTPVTVPDPLWHASPVSRRGPPAYNA